MTNAIYGLNNNNNDNNQPVGEILQAIQAAQNYVSSALILASDGKSIWYPYGKILKDIGKTFKSYQHAGKATQDLLQPVRGLGNMLFGVAEAAKFLVMALIVLPLLIVTLVPILGAVLGAVLFVSSDTDSIGKAILAGLAGALLGGVLGLGVCVVVAPIYAVLMAATAVITAIHSAGYLLRGVSQIVTTPLTWLVRMPLRGLITAIKGSPKIEASNKLDRMVTEIETVTNSNNAASLAALKPLMKRNVDAIHNKFVRHAAAGQDTGISISTERVHYTQLKESITSEKLVAYVGQFRAAREALSEDNATPIAQATATAA